MANHAFNTTIAEQHGIIEAILLENICNWINHNKANGKHFHEGKTWTYNSVPAYCELFPYMGERQIRDALKRLHDKGIIEKGNYNNSAYDRTTWYTVKQEFLDEFYPIKSRKNSSAAQSSPQQPDIAKCNDATLQNSNHPSMQNAYLKDDKMHTPIPYINTDINNINARGEKIESKDLQNVPYQLLTKDQFKQQIDLLRGQPGGYSDRILNDFYDHWTEQNMHGRMLFQLQHTWNLTNRLKKWKEKQDEIDKRVARFEPKAEVPVKTIHDGPPLRRVGY
jgi:hypothetical protein